MMKMANLVELTVQKTGLRQIKHSERK